MSNQIIFNIPRTFVSNQINPFLLRHVVTKLAREMSDRPVDVVDHPQNLT